MHLPTNFQTAGPFRLGGGEIGVTFIVVGAVWLLCESSRPSRFLVKASDGGSRRANSTLRDAKVRPRRINKRQPAAYRVGYNSY